MPALAFSRTRHTGTANASAIRDKIHYLERTSTYAPAIEAPLLSPQNDCRHRETLNLPSWAENNADFFVEADHWEGGARHAFVEWKFDLPKALSHEQHIELTRDIFAGHLRGIHPVTWVKHEPNGIELTLHPHVHAIWSARPVKGDDLSPEHFFSRRNPKTRDLGEYYAPEREKQMITDVMNLHMEEAGLTLRYSPLSYEERGIAMTPEPKARPSDSYRFAATGEISDRLRAVFDHREAMEPYKEEERRDAQARWEVRKHQLGISHDTTHGQALGRIADATRIRGYVRPTLAEKQRRQTQQLASLRHELQVIDTKIRVLTREQQHLKTPTRRIPQERAPGSSFRLKIHEKEHEYERDIGYSR